MRRKKKKPFSVYILALSQSFQKLIFVYHGSDFYPQYSIYNLNEFLKLQNLFV